MVQVHYWAWTVPVLFPEKAFQAFLIAGIMGGFLVCICYAFVSLGALATFATKKPIDLIAALLGLATCVLGIAAQFVDGTAPTGDARWGISLALVAIGSCAAWIAVSKRENLEKAGNHALQHKR